MAEKNDYKGRKFKASVYDKAYFEGGTKSGYNSYSQAQGIIDDLFSIIGTVMADVEPKTHLDVACAYGWSVRKMTELGWVSQGMDISKFAIDQAKKLFPEFTFLQEDAAKDEAWQDYKKKQFGLVTANEFFEHIESDHAQQVIEAMARVSHWGLFVINGATSPTGDLSNHHDHDEGHLNHHNMSWWITQFAKVGDIDFNRMYEFSKAAEKKHPSVYWHNRCIIVKFA